MNKVIISGVSSFIGRALAKALLKQNVVVYGLSSHPESMGPVCEYKNFHLINADFKSYHQLAQKISDVGFDVFFHLAWQGYGKATNDYAVQIPNIQYSCEAEYAAISLNCKRFVFAGSGHEFLKKENARGKIELCSVYGTAKYAAQRMCKTIAFNEGIEFVEVLFSNIYGVGDTSHRSTNTILRKLINGQDLDLTDGTNLYDWTYIEDCVDGVIAAAHLGLEGRSYYVGSKLRPFSEIIREVRDIVAPQVKLNFGKYPDNSFIDYDDIDIDALYNDTKFIAKCNFQEGIEKTVCWLKNAKENFRIEN